MRSLLRHRMGHATTEDRSRHYEQLAAVIEARPERAADLMPADPLDAAWVEGSRRYRRLLAELQQRSQESTL